MSAQNSLLDEVQKFAGKYYITFQFWGIGNNNAYVEKDNVELLSSGGWETPDEAIEHVLNYLYRINRVPTNKRISLKHIPENER